MEINHVRLLVVNFTGCFRFYRDVIGLKVLWGEENDAYASFSQPGVTQPNIALFRRTNMAEVLGTAQLPLDAPGMDRQMLIIGVENVDAEVKRLRALNVPIVLGPRNFPDWGYRGAYLRDPDGNLIELAGALPEEEWSADLRQAAEHYRQADS